MEREISSGATLGIVLIALAALIAIGFGVFAIAKGTANEGTTKVQTSLSEVSASEFTDYDQKVVTGTQVISAYENFQSKPYTILISTQATKDAYDTGNWLGTVLPTISSNPALVMAYDADGTTGIITSKSDDTDTELIFLNYNAVIGEKGSEIPIRLDNGTYIVDTGFAVDAGKMVFASSKINLSKSGMTEYVGASSRFQANLIKDSSGSILGIAFEQVGASN